MRNFPNMCNSHLGDSEKRSEFVFLIAWYCESISNDIMNETETYQFKDILKTLPQIGRSISLIISHYIFTNLSEFLDNPVGHHAQRLICLRRQYLPAWTSRSFLPHFPSIVKQTTSKCCGTFLLHITFYSYFSFNEIANVTINIAAASLS